MMVTFLVPCAVADDVHSSNWTESDMFFAALNKIGDDLDYGTGILGLGLRGVSSMGSQYLGEGSVCKMSDDGLHHSSKYNQLNGGGSDLVGGKYLNYQCDYCGQMFKAYYNDLESAYDNNVKNNYPLNVYASNGQYYWYPTWNDLSSDLHIQIFNDKLVIPLSELNGYTHSVNYLSESCNYTFSIVDPYCFVVSALHTHSLSVFLVDDANLFNAPVSGEYYLERTICVYCKLGRSNVPYYYAPETLGYFSQGYSIPLSFKENHGPQFSYFYAPVFRVVPQAPSIQNFYVQNTRVGSVNFNLATKQGDNITNVYQNVQIVNENTNVYTDPTTGTQQNIKSWTYDYSTRTYHLTLEDGSLLDVEFGEDSIKVKINGEITQEYYYTVEKEPEPTASPVPSPTPEPGPTSPEPEPTPSPEPGPRGEDGPPDGFFEWLKQWLIDFKEWLGDWLDKLFNKEPGDITIDESDNSVHIEDNDSVDYDRYYSDDQGEQHQTSLRDIIHKFGFLQDIYDLGRDMFTIVGADAVAAYAYDPGGTIDITPYLGDLRTVAAEDIMPIAGAPSLKLDLGAAQSHYGYEYGGEIEFLDLSWYTPYKQTVDSLLSGFLWLMFIWRLFKVAPGIISGAGMVTDKAEDIHDGKRH